MIAINKKGSVHCSYSSYDCKWSVVEDAIYNDNIVTSIFILYASDMVFEKFDTEDDAINCLKLINQKWLEGCDIYQIED